MRYGDLCDKRLAKNSGRRLCGFYQPENLGPSAANRLGRHSIQPQGDPCRPRCLACADLRDAAVLSAHGNVALNKPCFASLVAITAAISA